VNEEELTPQELGEIVAYVQAHHREHGQFDVAVYGLTPSNPDQAAQIVQPWIEAGATWWRESIGDWRGTLKTVRARIRSGPPRA
jgi:hypothetical protein